MGTKQIFLNFKGKLLPIHSLLTDVYGIFTPLKDILLMRGLWGDTWIYPNPNCGYENYNKINFCGVCETKKP
ncbi:hypothetical protein DB44_FW00020 [Candidatus Protochlamydia amoebophila]|uniref:RanBP2-type domain-containing protein n=1 Tax=Candidatus Protochlamydia amoebophila TaxID=362787 RepID=A0A0C1JJL5_9BACT|nr:hypothetical protein DB44_FW00020 [Candidatus Protochlamydia amoebophila]